MTSGNNRTRSAKHVIQPGSIVQRPAGGLIAAFAIAAGLLMSAIGAKSQEYPAKPKETPQQFQGRMRKDYNEFRSIVKAANLKPE